MNYPLLTLNKADRNLLTPQKSYCSDEYCKKMRRLYLSDEVHRNEKGNMQKYYRLHAAHEHTLDQALAYEIKCPSCGNIMKQVAHQNSSTELGLYTCKHCN